MYNMIKNKKSFEPVHFLFFLILFILTISFLILPIKFSLNDLNKNNLEKVSEKTNFIHTIIMEKIRKNGKIENSDVDFLSKMKNIHLKIDYDSNEIVSQNYDIQKEMFFCEEENKNNFEQENPKCLFIEDFYFDNDEEKTIENLKKIKIIILI